jgi:hypothetical protein
MNLVFPANILVWNKPNGNDQIVEYRGEIRDPALNAKSADGRPPAEVQSWFADP